MLMSMLTLFPPCLDDRHRMRPSAASTSKSLQLDLQMRPSTRDSTASSQWVTGCASDTAGPSDTSAHPWRAASPSSLHHPSLPAPTHCLALSLQRAKVWHCGEKKMSQSEGGCGKRQSCPERSGEPSSFHPPLPRCSERRGCDVIVCCVSKLSSQQLQLRIYFFQASTTFITTVSCFGYFLISYAATHAMAGSNTVVMQLKLDL